MRIKIILFMFAWWFLIIHLSEAGDSQIPFKSASARAAKRRYESAIERAKQEAVRKIEIARKSYQTALDKELKSAMQRTDLDEANKINAEKKKIDQESLDSKIVKDGLATQEAWLVKLCMSSDHAFEVFVDGREFYNGGPKRGIQSEPMTIRTGTVITVALPKNVERPGFVMWIVGTDGKKVIIPEWYAIPSETTAGAAHKLPRLPTKKVAGGGFSRVAFHGYFRDVPGVVQHKAPAIWPSKSSVGIITKIDLSKALKVTDK